MLSGHYCSKANKDDLRIYFKVLNHMSNFQSSTNFRMFLQILKLAMHWRALVHGELNPTGVHRRQWELDPLGAQFSAETRLFPFHFIRSIMSIYHSLLQLFNMQVFPWVQPCFLWCLFWNIFWCVAVTAFWVMPFLSAESPCPLADPKVWPLSCF